MNEIERALSVRYLFEPIQSFLDLPDITEIAINRPNEIWVEKNSRWQRFDVELSFDHLKSMATAVASYTDNNVSTTTPALSAVLPDKERIQFVLSPAVAPDTMSVTIRKPSKTSRRLHEYEQDGFFDHVRHSTNSTHDNIRPRDKELLTLKKSDIPAFLRLAVQLQKTMVISGGTGSGKTTFMRALIEEINPAQRIITIEDVEELFLPNHPNHVHLFYPSEAMQGDPVTSASLLKSCLRMKPDRIMLAELRGAETFDFINVGASGHGGSITSCHANSAAMTFERMALMVLQNPQGRSLPYDVILRLLHQVIDIVIHVENDVYSTEPLGRHVTEIYFDPSN